MKPVFKNTGSDCRQKAILPRRGRIALSANERIAEFLDFAIQAKFAYVNKLASLLEGRLKSSPPVADSDDAERTVRRRWKEFTSS